jgi:hypothetical protein
MACRAAQRSWPSACLSPSATLRLSCGCGTGPPPPGACAPLHASLHPPAPNDLCSLNLESVSLSTSPHTGSCPYAGLPYSAIDASEWVRSLTPQGTRRRQ